MNNIKNAASLVDAVLSSVPALRAGKMKQGIAKEISNASGRAVSIMKLQLEYAAHRKETAFIPFLKTAEEKK